MIRGEIEGGEGREKVNGGRIGLGRRCLMGSANTII